MLQGGDEAAIKVEAWGWRLARERKHYLGIHFGSCQNLIIQMTFGKRSHFVTGSLLETTLHTFLHRLLQHGSLLCQTLQAKETIAGSATKSKVAMFEVMSYHPACILFIKNVLDRLAHIQRSREGHWYQGWGKSLVPLTLKSQHTVATNPVQFRTKLQMKSMSLWSRSGMSSSILGVSLVLSSAVWRQSCTHGKKRGYAYLS